MFLKTGARKKKSLTEKVDLLPFPAQNLRDKVADKPKVSQPDAAPNTAEVQKTKILQSPTGNSQVKTISIYKHMHGSQEAEPNFDNYPHEDYTIEAVKVLWRQYAGILKNKGEITFSSILANTEPVELQDDRFGIEVQSEIQANMIKDSLLEMSNFFRKSLKNYRFSFEMVLDNKVYSDVQFKNGRDKFKAMAQKNPNLENFRRLFDLDIEY